ncbi:hypothetical protein PMAYCL1PPCAC_22028, partial [Pristionchus mayeri]
EIERRLRERNDIRLGAAVSPDERAESGDQRTSLAPPRSERRYSMLPLLESTPLRTRAPGVSRRPADAATSAARRSLAKDMPPERVSVGVGTSARDLPEEEHHELASTGVQCELEESSLSSRGAFVLSTSGEESSSFGQVPDRLLLQHVSVRLVQPEAGAAPETPTPRPRTTAPRVSDASAAFRVREATISSSDDGGLQLPPLAQPRAPAHASRLSSPDSMIRGLLLEAEGAPPARMYPSSDESGEEAENTLENLESIRED